MKFGLNTMVIEDILKVLAAFPNVEEAIIYGSRALDTYREGSDIDLTLKGDLSYQDLLEIMTKLDERMLPYTFDLSIYHLLQNKDLLEHIDRVGKTLYVRKAVEGKMHN